MSDSAPVLVICAFFAMIIVAIICESCNARMEMRLKYQHSQSVTNLEAK